jgi:predicted Na+-dependent transporter
MKNIKNNSSPLIAALTLTAVVLGAILLATPSRTAQANMLNAQAGFSMLTSGILANDEALTIIDKGQQKMIVYTLVNNVLTPIAGYDLAKAMVPAPVK